MSETHEEKTSQTRKWYRQTALWAILISVTALVLSQLPPVANWIPRQSVDVELSKRIALPSTLGITAYQIFIDLKNSGNRSLTLSDLELQVIFPNGTVKSITADSYLRTFPGQQEPQVFPLTGITLNTGDRWTEMVIFDPPPSPSDDQEMNRLKMQISQSIFTKEQALHGKGSVVPRLAADKEFVDEARKFFERKFEMAQGIYKVSLTGNVNGQKEILKTFEFALYEYQINTLKLQVEDYRFGYGLLGQGDPNKQVWAVITRST